MKTQRKKEYKGFRGAGVRLTEEVDTKMMAYHSSDVELKSLHAYHM